jgi:ribonucleotide reductase beta subunit family protein with ferritin-like domain
MRGLFWRLTPKGLKDTIEDWKVLSSNDQRAAGGIIEIRPALESYQIDCLDQHPSAPGIGVNSGVSQEMDKDKQIVE